MKNHSVGIPIVSSALITISVFNIFNFSRFYVYPIVLGLRRGRLMPGLLWALLGVLLATLLLVSAINIIRLLNWGRKLAIIILTILSLYLSFISYAFFFMLLRYNFLSLAVLLKVAELLVYVSFIVYLTRPRVKELFA